MLSGQTWSILEHAFANGSLWWDRTNVFTPHASLTVPEPLSPMVHHTEAVDAWNLKPPRIQLGVLSRHTSCNAHTLSQCSFCQVHHATLRLLPHAIPISCGTPKKLPKQNPCVWWSLGDVVSRPLPHGIWDTSEDAQVGDFPQKSGLVCAWTVLSLFVQVCWGSLASSVSSKSTSLTPKMQIWKETIS